MMIKSAEFVRGAVEPGQWPDDGLPQVAFCGRSNVGKSSLINCLVQRRKLAVVSNTPGRTRQINFFLINNACYFVDLPGYGFAKAPKAEKARWGEMIETYLEQGGQLHALVLILDIRRTPNADDLQMLQWASYFGTPTVLALTKVDKISRNQRAKQTALIKRTVETEIQPDDSDFIHFSAKTRENREAILERLEGLL